MEATDPNCLRDDMFCFGHYDANGDGYTDSGASLCEGICFTRNVLISRKIRYFEIDVRKARLFEILISKTK